MNRLLRAAGGLAIAAALPVTAFTTDAQDLEPLVQVSRHSLFDDCTSDGGQGGTVFKGAEVEPWVVANPRDPRHLVGTWQQDRWSSGAARGLAVGVSFDAGATWQSVVVPGLTRCSGGSFLRASDPWLTFTAAGDLFHASLALTSSSTTVSAILVSRSTDGGLTWGEPSTLIQSHSPFFNDKESITADPHDPDLVYVVWDQINFSLSRGPALLARTTDGGETWESPRIIYDPGRRSQTIGNQIVVLPDGTLLDFFTEILRGNIFLAYRRSTDAGVTWGPGLGPVRVTRMGSMGAIDPDTGITVRDGAFLFDVAVDPVSGALYAVWQEGGFSFFRYPAIAFSRSTDGGLSWTAPARINRIPGATDLERQAFTPSVAVSPSGAIGVSYFDFRLNHAAAGALTDRWFISCHPDIASCDRFGTWQEARITDESFDIKAAPFAGGLFLGDYMGLAAAGDDFDVLFTQTGAGDRASAFHRRVRMSTGVAPRGLGWWRKQV
ncbi:MAG: sialidase family protein, partial [Acidobacteriota bacterium]